MADEDESLDQRDTLPPTPEKAKIIDTAINSEVLSLLESVGGDKESDEDDVPSIPPPDSVPMEKIEEGVQYRIVEPATKLPAPSAAGGESLARKEAELREREERILQREVVLGGREKILKKREEKLHQREVRLRNWEAKLMDKEAALRESYPPAGPAPPAADERDARPPVRRSTASDFRIEIAGGSGVWEMVEEPGDDSGDGA